MLTRTSPRTDSAHCAAASRSSPRRHDVPRLSPLGRIRHPFYGVTPRGECTMTSVLRSSVPRTPVWGHPTFYVVTPTSPVRGRNGTSLPLPARARYEVIGTFKGALAVMALTGAERMARLGNGNELAKGQCASCVR